MVFGHTFSVDTTIRNEHFLTEDLMMKVLLQYQKQQVDRGKYCKWIVLQIVYWKIDQVRRSMKKLLCIQKKEKRHNFQNQRIFYQPKMHAKGSKY